MQHYFADFVDWFLCLCLDNINPGSCYQRLKTSLDWLTVLLDVFVYVPRHSGGSLRRKGTCPGWIYFILL